MQLYAYIYVYIPKYLVNKPMCYFSSNEIQMNICLEKRNKTEIPYEGICLPI